MPGTSLGQVPLHGSFAVERDLAAPPSRVFAAYADVAVRRRWFRIPGDPTRAFHALDFRVGGSEESRGVFAPLGPGGPEERIAYRSVFWDVVPPARLVFGYELVLNDVRRWVSLVTVELSPLSPQESLSSPAALSLEPVTRLRHAEQYVLLAYAEDGAQDVAHLKGSTQLQLNGLAAALGAVGLTFWVRRGAGPGSVRTR